MRTTICALVAVFALQALAQERERNIGAAYDALAPLSCSERKALVHEYPREQQLELWTLHLQRFLAAHPELSGEQRSLVFEGLGMISSGLLHRTDDPAAKSLVAAFKQRAQQQFDRDTFADAFVRLGGRPDRSRGDRRPSRVRTTIPDCACADEGDCGGFDCYNFTCRFVEGCGPFGFDICTGLC